MYELIVIILLLGVLLTLNLPKKKNEKVVVTHDEDVVQLKKRIAYLEKELIRYAKVIDDLMERI